MIVERFNHGTYCLGDIVYAFGSCTNTSAEYYSLSRNVWVLLNETIPFESNASYYQVAYWRGEFYITALY
jgi:hypothetical protein